MWHRDEPPAQRNESVKRDEDNEDINNDVADNVTENVESPLSIKDMSVKQEETAQKLRIIDPSKAEQLERLGMGFQSVITSKDQPRKGSKGGKSSGRSGVSHSAFDDMEVIEQVEEKSSRKQSLGDEFGITRQSPSSRDLDRDMMLLDLGLSSGNRNDTEDFFSSFGLEKQPTKQSSYEIEELDMYVILT